MKELESDIIISADMSPRAIEPVQRGNYDYLVQQIKDELDLTDDQVIDADYPINYAKRVMRGLQRCEAEDNVIIHSSYARMNSNVEYNLLQTISKEDSYAGPIFEDSVFNNQLIDGSHDMPAILPVKRLDDSLFATSKPRRLATRIHRLNPSHGVGSIDAIIYNEVTSNGDQAVVLTTAIGRQEMIGMMSRHVHDEFDGSAYKAGRAWVMQETEVNGLSGLIQSFSKKQKRLLWQHYTK